MKKRSSVLRIIVTILLFVGGVECLIFSAITSIPKEPPRVENISNICVNEINDFTTIYIENLEVIKRYAFKTEHEYNDNDGYSDTTYYVYPGDAPMDDNELHAEYYIVKFRDNTGKEQLASLSVSATKDMASALTKTPSTISACFSVGPISNSGVLNSYDEELNQIRSQSLDEYAAQSGLPQANITIGYQAETIEQYQKNFQNDKKTSHILAAVFGVLLIVAGTMLLLHAHKKQPKS